jgi:hypothetical protein
MNHSDDHAAYDAAVKVFLLEPEALTTAQIDALTAVDDKLGAYASRKRDNAHTKAAEARHRAAMGQSLDRKAEHAAEAEAFADHVVDHILLALAHPKRRIKTLETSTAGLAARCHSLEARVLELEAREAARQVQHDAIER